MSGATSSQSGLTRRSFLKATGAAAGAAAMGGMLVQGGQAQANAAEKEGSASESIYNCACRTNCNGACRLNAHVIDGKIVKMSPAGYPEDGYRGCCLRGLSYIERIYGPNRIKYPMRRVGERGADQWERITWDEAVDEIATKFQKVIDEYGPAAVAIDTASGNYGFVHGGFGLHARLANAVGFTKLGVCYDFASSQGINRVVGTGSANTYANEPSCVLDSTMMVAWGTNPVYTAPQNWRWIQRAKEEKGTKLVCIDPIKSATSHKCDEYIKVNPGHDGYLALAMSNYIIQHEMVDYEFLYKKSTAAFLVRRDTKMHLTKGGSSDDGGSSSNAARGDGVVETDPNAQAAGYYVWDGAVDAPRLVEEAEKPLLEGSFVTAEGIEVDTAYTLLKKDLEQYSIAEASRLCGVPEDRIVSFAEDFASQEAVTVNITYGIDHYTNGYQNCWAVAMLMALTGNFAKKGAGFTGVWNQTYMPNLTKMYTPKNAKGMKGSLPGALLHETIVKQELEGKPYPIKAMFSAYSNPISNFAAQNNFFNKVLPNLDFWVYVDMEMTDSARYADLVLPQASSFEFEDFVARYNIPYTVIQDKAIDPLYESKPDGDIVCMIGRALGYEDAFPESYTFDDWAGMLLTDKTSKELGITLERLRKEKVIRSVGVEGESFVLGMSIPFVTESKRARIYCERPAVRLDYGQDMSAGLDREHIVYYKEPQEVGVDNELRKKYPLVFLQEHARYRTHSQWFETPILKELDPEPVAKISQEDAAARGVVTGDLVEVFNDRGHAVVKCVVDNSISQGVISIPKGWQRNQFIAGCFQEMTNPNVEEYASSFAYYDTLVDFKKWEAR